MRLLPSTELEELNRVLVAVAELDDQDRGCPVLSVVSLCSSVALGGRPVNHRRTLETCSHAGLVSILEGNVTLTDMGREFLDLNPSRSYELTDEQKRFVANRLVLSGPWRPRARDVFLSFSPNYSEITYEFALKANPIPVRLASAVYLLRKLEVLVEAEAVLSVAPAYVAAVAQLLASRKGTTEDELARALQANQKLGARAEEAMLAFERMRLRTLGRPIEASLVRRISQLDVGVGYDIQSYDGDKPMVEYDRFIEVKASARSQLRFYWTANERRAAERLRDKYWIYFVGSFRDDERSSSPPIMIQDPAARLPQVPQLRMEVSTYMISQSQELVVEAVGQEPARGFLL